MTARIAGKLSLALLAFSFLLTLARVVSSISNLPVPPAFMFLITLSIFVATILSSADSIGLSGTTLLFTLSAGIGLLMELLGVIYGFPFGKYSYSGKARPIILGLVPLNIPLFWFVISYSSLSITNVILKPKSKAAGRAAASLLDGLCATSWDLIMDPVQVNIMHSWTWEGGGEFYGVPLTNFIGWTLVVWIITFTFRTIYHGGWRQTDVPLLIYLQLWFAMTAAALLGGRPEYIPAGIAMIIFALLYIARRGRRLVKGDMVRISRQIFPRPVALIVTVNREGKPNVATFSFIMPVSFNPKYVAVSVSPKRYTFQNLKETQEFTLNILEKGWMEKAEICGTHSGRDVDKIALAGLETVPSSKVKPPRIKGCPVQLECKVAGMNEYGDHYLVVGKVEAEHVEKEGFQPLLHITGKIYASAKPIRHETG